MLSHQQVDPFMKIDDEYKDQKAQKGKSKFSDHQGGFDDAFPPVQKNTGPQNQDITQDDKNSQPYWKMKLYGQGNQDGKDQKFVGQGIKYFTYFAFLMEFSGQKAIQEIKEHGNGI